MEKMKWQKFTMYGYNRVNKQTFLTGEFSVFDREMAICKFLKEISMYEFERYDTIQLIDGDTAEVICTINF